MLVLSETLSSIRLPRSIPCWPHIAANAVSLSAWTVRRSAGWLGHVTVAQTEAELTAIRRSVNRDSPFGDDTWPDGATEKLGLDITTRPHGLPGLKEYGVQHLSCSPVLNESVFKVVIPTPV